MAGYSGLTREAYTLDLRQYVAWCTEHRVAVFGARRADIECFLDCAGSAEGCELAWYPAIGTPAYATLRVNFAN